MSDSEGDAFSEVEGAALDYDELGLGLDPGSDVDGDGDGGGGGGGDDSDSDSGSGSDSEGGGDAAPAEAGPQRQRVRYLPAEERRTSDVLTPAEAARLVSVRARLLEINPTVFLEEGAGVPDNAVDIAWKELHQRRLPLVLRREVERTPAEVVYERWDPRTMTIPPGLRPAR